MLRGHALPASARQCRQLSLALLVWTSTVRCRYVLGFPPAVGINVSHSPAWNQQGRPAPLWKFDPRHIIYDPLPPNTPKDHDKSGAIAIVVGPLSWAVGTTTCRRGVSTMGIMVSNTVDGGERAVSTFDFHRLEVGHRCMGRLGPRLLFPSTSPLRATMPVGGERGGEALPYVESGWPDDSIHPSKLDSLRNHDDPSRHLTTRRLRTPVVCQSSAVQIRSTGARPTCVVALATNHPGQDWSDGESADLGCIRRVPTTKAARRNGGKPCDRLLRLMSCQ